MHFPKNFFFLLTVCLTATALGNHPSKNHQCFERVQWSELLQEIEKVNKRSFSLDCGEVGNEDLCFPEQMLKAVKYDYAAIARIIHELAEFFKRSDAPFQNKNIFLRGMYEAHAQLRACLKSRLNTDHESIVKACFRKMNKAVLKTNNHCTWQEIHAQSREILQRIENFSFKRRAIH